MAGFFYQLGKMVGPKLRQANWVFRSLTGTETEAARAEYAVGQDLARVLAGQLEIDPDPGVRHLLQEVVARLAACLRNRQQRFTVHAVRASPVNAFALPGGFLFI